MKSFENALLQKEHAEFARYCSGWNKRFKHRPDFVVAASSGKHVQDAVRFAAERGLLIRVQATGHGALAEYEGGVLIDTSAIGGVEIDQARRTATLGAGVRWRELLDAAQPFGLTGLAGSSAGVGVVGYALGGGNGWLARRYGLCSDTIEAAEITTADGVRRWIDDVSEPDLLWGLRGGGSNFGIVSALRLRLVANPVVFAGAIYWPMAGAAEILSAYRDWIASAPPEMGSAIAFLQIPSAAPVPQALRGNPVVAFRLCHPGATEEAVAAIAPMRKIPGVLLDTTRSMPFREIGAVSLDSPLELSWIGYSQSLQGISPKIIAGLPEILKAGAAYQFMELRRAGAGVATPPPGYEGMGYWQSPFLFMGRSVHSDPASAMRSKYLGEQLDELFSSDSTGMNAFTFLLDQHTPACAGEVERVRTTFSADHYARLATLKKAFDPKNLMGCDRNVPPAA
jgi:FAD/FMN-containing dehydrogenase